MRGTRVPASRMAWQGHGDEDRDGPRSGWDASQRVRLWVRSVGPQSSKGRVRALAEMKVPSKDGELLERLYQPFSQQLFTTVSGQMLAYQAAYPNLREGGQGPDASSSLSRVYTAALSTKEMPLPSVL